MPTTVLEKPATGERLLSPKFAAALLGVCLTNVYNLMNQGRLPYSMIGGSRRIRYSVLMTLIAETERFGRRDDWISPRDRAKNDD